MLIRFSFLAISCSIHFIVDYHYNYNDGCLLCGRLFVLMCTNHNPSSTPIDEKEESLFFLSRTRKEREGTVAGEYFYSLLDLFFVAHNNLLTFSQWRPQIAQYRTFSFFSFVSPCIEASLLFECLPYSCIKPSIID